MLRLPKVAEGRQRAKSQEPRAKSQKPKAKSQKPKAKSQKPKAKSQKPKANAPVRKSRRDACARSTAAIASNRRLPTLSRHPIRHAGHREAVIHARTELSY